jgi:hypothetical protein
MERQADFGGFLGETFSLIGDGVKGVLIFVLVVAGLNAAGIALSLVEPDAELGGFDMGLMIDANSGAAAAAFQLGTWVVTFIASYLLLAHFLEARGRLPNRETRIWAYVGLSILAGLGTMVGFILLIVPGVILVVRWSASSGFLISGRMGIIDSLTASWEATRGHSWAILGASLVWFIGLLVIAAVLGAAEGIDGSMTAIGILSGLAEAIASAVFLALGLAIFLLVHSDAEVFA